MAAGQGRRFSGGKIKALLEIDDEFLIIRIIKKFKQYGIDNITIVTGFQGREIEENIRLPGVRFIHNLYFEYTENLVSFWFGARDIEDDCLLSHCDLIFEDRILENVINGKNDIVLPYDRTSINKEAMKIRFDGTNIIEISKAIPVNEAFGESIPLMKFSRRMLRTLVERAEAKIANGYTKSYIEDALMNVIRNDNLSCEMIDASDCKWMEIDNQEDYQKAKELFRIGK